MGQNAGTEGILIVFINTDEERIASSYLVRRVLRVPYEKLECDQFTDSQQLVKNACLKKIGDLTCP